MSTELAIVIKASALTGAASSAVQALGGSLDKLGRTGSVATTKLGREYSLLTRRAQALNTKLFDVSAFAASKRINQRLGESYQDARDKANGLYQSLSQAKKFAAESQSALAAFRRELAGQTGKATDAQSLKLKLLGDQAKGAQSDVGRLTAEFRLTSSRVKELDTRLNESRLSLQTQREQLQKNGIATSQLSAHKSQLIKQLEQEQSRIQSLGKTYAALEKNQARSQAVQLKRTAHKEQGSALNSEAVGALAAAGSIILPVKQAMAFESAMANVKKVVTFDTPQQFKEMGSDIMEMTRTIPLAGTEIASLYAQGGQAGIARENLKGFAIDAAKMGVAFDMAASEAGTAMAGMSNVLKIPIGMMGQYGDVINHLADNANSNARDIVNVLTRVGSATTQLGLSKESAAALSSTFLSMNKPPELAAQAIQGLTQTLSLAKVGEFDGELKKLGLTTKGFAAAMDKDAQGALTDFLGRVKQLPKNEQYPFLIEMFGKNYADDVQLITNNMEEYNRQLKAVSDTNASGDPLYKGSMSREFENQSATTDNQFKLFKNGLAEVGKTVGDQVLPAFNALLKDTLIPLSHTIADYMKQNPELAKGLVTVAVALAGFKAGGFAVRYMLHGLSGLSLGTHIRFLAFAKAILQGKGALQALRLGLGLSSRSLIRQGGMLGTVARGFAHVSRFAKSAAGKGLSALSRGFASVSTFAVKAASAVKKFAGTKLGKGAAKGLGAAAGAYGLYDTWKNDKNAGEKNQTTGQKVASYAQGAMSGAAIGAMFGPIGAAVGAALGLIYTLVVRNWDAIKTYISGKIDQIKSYLGMQWEAITQHPAKALAKVGETILNWSPVGLFYKAFAAVMNYFGAELPATFTGFGSMIMQGLLNGISSMFDTVVGKIKSLGTSMSDAFTSNPKIEVRSPSRAFKRYGSFITEGLGIGIEKGAARPLSSIGSVATNLQQRFKKRAGQLQSTMTARMQYNAAELTQSRTAASAAGGANGGGYVIHYSPQISVPSGNTEQVKDALRLSQREFEAMFERMTSGNARRSYS